MAEKVEEYRGCVIPKDLYYDIENQVWFRVNEDGTVTVGVTDIGQARAGKIINIRIKAPGKKLKKGKPVASLESGKWAGPVPADIEGEVVERNEKLFDKPDLINEDPYGEGWIAKIKPTNLERDLQDLVTGEEAIQKQREYIEREDVNCGEERAQISKKFYK